MQKKKMKTKMQMVSALLAYMIYYHITLLYINVIIAKPISDNNI